VFVSDLPLRDVGVLVAVQELDRVSIVMMFTRRFVFT